MSSSIVYSWKLQYFCELLFRKVQSIVSENCGLDNSVQALVASSRQDTTYLATRVKTRSHIVGDVVKSDGDSREDRGI